MVSDGVPKEYKVRGVKISVYFGIQPGSGKLKVEIIQGGKIIASSETSLDNDENTLALISGTFLGFLKLT